MSYDEFYRRAVLSMNESITTSPHYYLQLSASESNTYVRRKDGRMEGWKDGWMDGRKEGSEIWFG
jgi:hypothetical protein